MVEKVSRYLVISDNVYGDETGMRTSVIYATRTAKVIFVLPEVARALREGRIEGISGGTLTELRQARAVVPADEDERAAVLERNRAASRDISTVQFILMPTSYCNMGCVYCGQEHVPGRMKADHRDRVRARVLRAMELPTTERVKIDWFGAEPMMGYAVIRDLAKDFTRVADERGLEYQSLMVTNGSLLNTRNLAVLIRECRVSKFGITLDGPPEIHDVHRPIKAGGGSFWKIVRTLQAFVDKPEYAHVLFELRTNVDIHNQDSMPRYIDLMADLGFGGKRNVIFSPARVRPWSNDVSAIELVKQDFAELELEWLRQMEQRGLNYMRMPNLANRTACPAVRESAELISGNGDIFSCTDHPLIPELEQQTTLGHVADAGLPVFRPEGLFDDWNDDIETGKSWCHDCVFMPTCGGMCPKLWREGYAPCPSYKFNAQGRLDLAAERLGLRPLAAV